MSIYFDQEPSRVSRIEWFRALIRFLPGRSRDLLSPAAFEQDSSMRLELLGREDSATRGADTRLDLTSQTFVYGKEGLQLVHEVVDLPSIHKTITVMKVLLVTPARAR